MSLKFCTQLPLYIWSVLTLRFFSNFILWTNAMGRGKPAKFGKKFDWHCGPKHKFENKIAKIWNVRTQVIIIQVICENLGLFHQCHLEKGFLKRYVLFWAQKVTFGVLSGQRNFILNFFFQNMKGNSTCQ